MLIEEISPAGKVVYRIPKKVEKTVNEAIDKLEEVQRKKGATVDRENLEFWFYGAYCREGWDALCKSIEKFLKP